MSLRTLLLVALLAALALAQVAVLEESNFDATIDGSVDALVEFYAPWCGHCKNLEPIYNELGDAYKHSSDVVIAKVDATENAELASRFGVSGYPTILFFAKGSTEPEKYTGGRELDDLAKFVQEKSGVRAKRVIKPTHVVELTPANFDEAIADSSKLVFVKFYAPWCGHCKSLAPVWDTLSDVFRNDPNVVIAKVNADAHRDLGTRYGVTGFPTLKVFGGSTDSYSGGRDLPSLVEFVNEQAGTHRLESGFLDDFAGRVADADDLVAAGGEALMEALEALSFETKGADASFARKIYLHTAKKAAAAADYVTKEKARLVRIMEGGSISDEKRDQFKIRYNILQAFAPDE